MRERIPIACTLDAGSLDARLAEWRSVLDHVEQREDIEGGLRLHLRGIPAADVARLAEAEQRCCAFFAFDLHLDADGMRLDVTAPADARSMVDAVFAS